MEKNRVGPDFMVADLIHPQNRQKMRQLNNAKQNKPR